MRNYKNCGKIEKEKDSNPSFYKKLSKTHSGASRRRRSMKQYRVIIIGGGASGMFAATLLGKTLGGGVAVVERNDRVGKKLLATGNGQGNIGNRDFSLSHYRGEEG